MSREIITFFEYPKSMVYDVAKRYMASEESEKNSPARKKHAREKTRTPELIQRAQELLEDLGTSIRKLVVLKESYSNVRLIVEDLVYVGCF